jgi:hypothetical protein
MSSTSIVASNTKLVGEVAGHLFGGAVAGRGVEHRGTPVRHHLDHLPERVQVVSTSQLGEGGRASQPDGGEHLAGGGNGPADERALLEGAEQAGVECRGAGGTEHGPDHLASVEHR